MKDYYSILGIKKGASLKEIKKAYKEMVKRWHPDFHPNDPDALKRIKDINEAYEVLANPKKRQSYHQRVREDETDYYRKMAYATLEDHPFFTYFLRFRDMSGMEEKTGENSKKNKR